MKEIIAAIIVIVLLALLLNPFDFWMPSNVQMLIVAATLVAFSAYALFVLRERALDEREEAHRSLAGRAGFLVGSALLVLGVALQSLDHAVDAWLVVTLAAMICAKLGARLYSDRNL